MIRCLIIDPDPSARKALSRELSRHEQFSIAGMYDSPQDVPFAVNRLTTDVLFIEVVLPGQNGLDYIRTMENPPLTVITTPYREYAVECFELDITDYLIKPVEPARLLKTLSKIERILPERKKHPLTLSESSSRPEGGGDHLFIRADKKQVKLYYNDILFVESIKDYICIHTVSGQYIIHQTLSGFTAALPQDGSCASTARTRYPSPGSNRSRGRASAWPGATCPSGGTTWPRRANAFWVSNRFLSSPRASSDTLLASATSDGFSLFLGVILSFPVCHFLPKAVWHAMC